MNTVRDLHCTSTPGLLPPEAHYECSVLYNTSEGPPACPTCGGARVPFYATREMEGKAVEYYDARLSSAPSPATPLAAEPPPPIDPGSMPPGATPT